MFANRHVRYLLGLVLGGCAGLSLTVSVLPVVLRLAGVGEELVLTRALAPLAPWAALMWAAGGISAARAGSPLAGAVILGLVGAAAAVMLVAFALALEPRSVLAAILAGGFYGALGGLIIGRVLAPRIDDDEDGS